MGLNQSKKFKMYFYNNIPSTLSKIYILKLVTSNIEYIVDKHPKTMITIPIKGLENKILDKGNPISEIIEI